MIKHAAVSHKSESLIVRLLTSLKLYEHELASYNTVQQSVSKLLIAPFSN